MTDIIKATETSAVPTNFTFKNEKLNQVSIKIARIYGKLAENRIEIAKCLGTVLHSKLYTDDGFTSVADYAEQTFGLQKATAYQLARVGERFYNNPELSPTVKEYTAKVTPSVLAELVNTKDEDIEAKLKSGEISENTTQKAIREAVQSTKLTENQQTYDIIARVYDGSTVTVAKAVGIYKGDFGAYINIPDSIQTPFSIPDFDSDIKLMYITDKSLMKFALVQYSKHIEAKQTKVKVDKKAKFTKEDILKMFTPEELAAILQREG